MTEDSIAASTIVSLLAHYGFDSGGLTVEQLVDQWLQGYPADWVYLALVEALYQGRYKVISVAQILAFWQRRGQPVYRFDLEFEQLICNRLPQKLLKGQPTAVPAAIEVGVRSDSKAQQIRSNATMSVNPAKQDKAVQNPLPTQARANSKSLSLPKIGSGSLLGITHLTAGREDNQLLQSPNLTVVSKTGLSRSDQVLSAPLVQAVKADQSELTAVNASQTIWSELEKDPIHQFTPDTGASSFHTKLSAIAQRLGTKIALAEPGGRSR